MMFPCIITLFDKYNNFYENQTSTEMFPTGLFREENNVWKIRKRRKLFESWYWNNWSWPKGRFVTKLSCSFVTRSRYLTDSHFVCSPSNIVLLIKQLRWSIGDGLSCRFISNFSIWWSTNSWAISRSKWRKYAKLHSNQSGW